MNRFLTLFFLIAPLAVATAANAATKINYQDHALPIFRNSCLGCHNPDKKKGGLDLTSWQAAMNGGSDGAVIAPGDPDGSLLYRVVTHADEPTMPPKRDKLPDAELDMIKRWILAGALPTASGKPVRSAKPKIDLSFKTPAGHRPDGPPPMPHDLLLESVVHAQRPGALSALAASPWAPLVAVAGQHEVLLYNPESLALLGVIPFAEGQPQVLSFSASGGILLVGGGQAAKSGKVVLWDVATGNHITDIGDEYDAVLAADISPDQTRVALGGPSKVLKVFATKDGSLIDSIKAHTDWVTAAAYSSDGVLLASGDRAGGLWVWEAKTDREFYNLAGHKAGITAVAFRPDSNVLASASEDGTIKLWDMNSGREARSWQAHADGVLSVSFASDGRIVSCGRDHIVKTWKPDGSPLRSFEPFNDIALKAVFDHDGSRIVAGDWTGEIRVWNAADGTRLGALDPNPPPLAERIDAAAQRIPPLQAAANRAAGELAAARQGQLKAQQALQAVQSALVTARQSVEDGRARVSAMEAAEHAASDALAASRAAAQPKEAEANRLNQVMQQASSARDAAQHEGDAAHAGIAVRQQAVDAATKALADANAAAAKPTTPPTTNPAATQPANAAIVAARAALEKATAELAAARLNDSDQANRLLQMSSALVAAQAAVARSNAELADARKTVADKDRTHSNVATQLQVARQALPKLQSDLIALEKQLGPQQDQMKNADQRVGQTASAADAANAQLAAARTELSQLKTGEFFLTVYAARKAFGDAQQQQEQMSQAFSAAQAAVDKAAGDLTAAQKSLADAPARIAARQDAIHKARDAQNVANVNVTAAQSIVAEKTSLQHDAAAMGQRIHDAAAKTPDDKSLADAAARSAATLDALAADVNTANQMAQQKIAEAKSAADRVASAQADLLREQADIANAPKVIDALKVALAAAQGEVPAKKSALDEASRTCDAAKAKVDQLEGDYHKMVQEAGAGSNSLPPGKT